MSHAAERRRRRGRHDWDLTSGGAHDEILIRRKGAGPASGLLRVTVKSTNGISDAVTRGNSGPGIYRVPFADMPTVTWDHVETLWVSIEAQDTGSWEIAPVETGTTLSLEIDWDVLLDVIDLCPLMMNLLWTSSGPYTDGTLTFDVDMPGSPGYTPQLSGPPGRWLVGTAGGETVSWNLARFLSSQLVDITQATFMELIFYAPPGGSDLLLYDLRFGNAATGPADFKGSFVATQFPPLPSAPLLFELKDPVTAVSVYEAQASVVNALTDAQTVPSADWTWNLTQTVGNDVAQMSLLWTDFGGILETTFDIQIGAGPVTGTALIDLYPPDPFHSPESIALSLPVVSRDLQGNATGASNTWLPFDFDEQQLGSLEFYEVSVTENPVTRSWTDGFTLHFRMTFSGTNSPDMQFPLFHATWMSDRSTQIPAAVAEPVVDAGGEPFRLTAAPGVTRAGTEIRASRPFERATSLLIHDVTGRRIRTLSAAVGSDAVRWDGKSNGGRPAAPGVYFVRIADCAGEAPIADFEEGGFSLQTIPGVTPAQDSVAIPGAWSEVIAAQRTLT